jgi:DNA segregation ATPase FtsK/SpoIIIE, S-DNA-T family
MKRRLHQQADQIEWLLATHKAPARVTGGRVTPRTIQFHLSPAPTTKISRVEKLAEEIALMLKVSSARILRENGALHIEIPRDDARALRFLELCAQAERDANMMRALRVAGTTLVGMGVDGVPLMLRLGVPDVPHVLIAGTTGSGKSQAARTLLASLVLYQPPREVQLLIIDPKGSDFRAFATASHLVCPIVQTVEDARERLDWLAEEMERRQNERVSRPRIIVLIDELADLLMQGGSALEDLLTRIIQRGRSAGICVIGCTQKPTAGVLGTLVKANFPVRLVGKVTSAHEALIAAGVAKSGAETLAGRGDFLLIANGETLRVQIAHLPTSDDDAFRAKFFR